MMDELSRTMPEYEDFLRLLKERIRTAQVRGRGSQ
jgi:hypothetical protein